MVIPNSNNLNAYNINKTRSFMKIEAQSANQQEKKHFKQSRPPLT